MEPFHPQSTSDQLTDHLRRQIQIGTLAGNLPGIRQLVQSLGVNSVAVTKAVRQLELEGLILYQGDRKTRQVASAVQTGPQSLKIGILYYGPNNAKRHDALMLKEGLSDAGHVIITPKKSMVELEMNTKRIIDLVTTMDLDAWIIYTGSKETLQWFQQHGPPAFALYGRFNSTSLAGMGIQRAKETESLLNKLISLGHKRIVLLVREERRKPELGAQELSFIHQLKAHGIGTGSYNIPDWDDTPEGLEIIINSLCMHTPPTAILVGDATMFHATQLHLAQRGLFAPHNISLFCFDHEETFDWTRPKIADITWDHRPIIRRIIQWANNTAQGKDDRKKSYVKAVLNEGGTIGPAPKMD